MRDEKRRKAAAKERASQRRDKKKLKESYSPDKDVKEALDLVELEKRLQAPNW